MGGFKRWVKRNETKQLFGLYVEHLPAWITDWLDGISCWDGEHRVWIHVVGWTSDLNTPSGVIFERGRGEKFKPPASVGKQSVGRRVLYR